MSYDFSRFQNESDFDLRFVRPRLRSRPSCSQLPGEERVQGRPARSAPFLHYFYLKGYFDIHFNFKVF